jgi:hypothetical protein
MMMSHSSLKYNFLAAIIQRAAMLSKTKTSVVLFYDGKVPKEPKEIATEIAEEIAEEITAEITAEIDAEIAT